MNQFDSQDRRAAAVIASGLVVRAVDRLLAQVWRSASDSTAAAAALSAVAGWTGLDTASRRFALGLLLITAAITHILLTIVTEVPWGWQWLILPALGAAVGGLLVLASNLPATAKS